MSGAEHPGKETLLKEMTSRERLWAVLNGQEPDRVPIWKLFPRERLGYRIEAGLKWGRYPLALTSG